jgi:hypothetical protein
MLEEQEEYSTQEESFSISQEEEQDVIKDLCDCAKRSDDKFSKEYDKMKTDRELFSSTTMWDDLDVKRFDGRIQPQMNVLPKYKNAICNSFKKFPYQIKLLNDKEGRVSELVKQTEMFSGADDVWSNGLSDTVISGLGYSYLTTEDNKFLFNYAYDPLLVIPDPCSTSICGKDQTFIAFLESNSYETLKEKYPNIESEQNLKSSNTYMLGKYWNSKKGSYNLITFFKKVGNDVKFYKIVGNSVLDGGTFTNVSSIPAVPIKGDEFWVENERQYKGIVRDVHDAIRIINYGYAQLSERLVTPSLPYDFISKRAIEGFESDYETTNVYYKRYNDYDPPKAGDQPGTNIPPPQHVTPEVRSGDLIAIINDAKNVISEIIGIPSSGLVFQGNAQQQTATEVLARSQSTVNNISHFYQHAKASMKQLATVLVEIICEYNQIENVFTVEITDGPEIMLQKENLRQQLVATASFVPETAKPLVMAEIIRTLDLPNADELANAVLQTLPENIRPTGMNIATLQTKLSEDANQITQLTTAMQQLAEKNKSLKDTIDNQVLQNHNQLAMLREQHENAIKLKLLDLDAQSKKNQQDLALKLAEATEDNKQSLIDAMQQQQKIDLESRKVLVQELETAKRMQQ